MSNRIKLTSNFALLLLCIMLFGKPSKVFSIEPVTGLSYIVTIMLLDLSSDDSVEKSKDRLREKIDEQTARRMALDSERARTNSMEASLKSMRTDRELIEKTIADMRRSIAELREENRRIRELLLELDYTTNRSVENDS